MFGCLGIWISIRCTHHRWHDDLCSWSYLHCLSLLACTQQLTISSMRLISNWSLAGLSIKRGYRLWCLTGWGAFLIWYHHRSWMWKDKEFSTWKNNVGKIWGLSNNCYVFFHLLVLITCLIMWPAYFWDELRSWLIFSDSFLILIRFMTWFFYLTPYNSFFTMTCLFFWLVS